MYPRETFVAEKYEAMVRFGVLNSRMKDLYDVWLLARVFPFEGPSLRDAIRATFARRGTAVPVAVPPGLAPAAAEDTRRAQQWTAFCRRTAVADAPDLVVVVTALRAFLLPPSAAAAMNAPFPQQWMPQIGWWASG
jgi:hypothetical protein